MKIVNSESEFMESPLVTWAQTISTATTGHTLEYLDFANGVFMNNVMETIDARFVTSSVHDPVEDVQMRLQNLDALLKNIKFFYHEVLKQWIVMGLPNIVKIARCPTKECGELQKLLLLILGCAVQCEGKEAFVQNITQLDIATQTAIVGHIKEITDNTENVFYVPWSTLSDVPPDQMEEVSHALISHLKKLIVERDDYLELLTEYVQEIASLHTASTSTPSGLSPKKSSTVGENGGEKHRLGVELADCKAKLRRARQELEEKSETVVELKEELQEKSSLYAKVRQDNLELTQEARAARTYRDELDILREKACRVDKLDLEINRYKEKLNELDYYRARVEELREDNVVLLETRSMLEDQLATSHSRLKGLVDLENDLVQTKDKLVRLENEREDQRERITELVAEVTKLESEKNLSMSESNSLGKELDELKSGLGDATSSWSLSDQIHESANAKIHRLELENQRLSSSLEKLRKDNEALNALHKTEGETQARRVSEVERENHRLAAKISKLQDDSASEGRRTIDLEGSKAQLIKEQRDLHQTIDTIRENTDRQIAELERENQSLSQMISTLRERNEKSEESKTKELEKENERYSEMVREWRNKASILEGENRSLNREINALKEIVDQCAEKDKEKCTLELKVVELNREMATLQLTCGNIESLETENADLRFDNQRLRKELANVENAASRSAATEETLVALKVENQRLARNLEAHKEKADHLINDLEHRKEEIENENQNLKKHYEAEKRRVETVQDLEAKLQQLDLINRKMQRELDLSAKKLENIEKENQDYERENENLMKTIETLKSSVNNLDALERDFSEMQEERNNLQAQVKAMEKESKRMKSALAIKESTIDENLARISAIEREIRVLRKNEDRRKDIEIKVKELEQENQELIVENGSDKKTLSALREELVNEKIRTQQLSNELEQLTAELERVGLTKERLVARQEDEKLTAMTTMMDDAYKRSLELKEDKIKALEEKLDEFSGNDERLRQELRQVKAQLEEVSRKAGAEKEAGVLSRDRPGSVMINAKETVRAQRELLQLKDRLVELERINASLAAEKTSNATQMNYLKEQLESTVGSSSNLHSQLSSLQSHNAALQAENAKIQVETATAKSQTSSLMSTKIELSSKLSAAETRLSVLLSERDDLNSSHEILLSDHEALTTLHEQLTREYDQLTDENTMLKTKGKLLRSEIKELQEKYDELVKAKEEVDALKTSLEQERDAIKRQSFALRTLPEDYDYLQQEVQKLSDEKTFLGEELKRIQSEAANAKGEHHSLQIEYTKLQGEYQNYKNIYDEMDIQLHKIASKCETLETANDRLEDDNRNLMIQLQTMITQNAELLQTTLSNKDVYHEEERQMIERLNALQRQKEKLEEKIMAQYREKTPKKSKGIGATLVRKARQVISRKPRSRSKDGVKYKDSEGSGAESDAKSKRPESLASSPWSMRVRTPSVESPSPRNSSGLGFHQRKLASSTNALNVMSVGKAYHQSIPRSNESRMYRSSENVLDSSLYDNSPRDDYDLNNHHYDVIESVHPANLNTEIRPPDTSSYASGDAGSGDGCQEFPVPKEAPISRPNSSRASSHGSSSISEETAGTGASEEKRASRIPFSTPEHAAAASPSSSQASFPTQNSSPSSQADSRARKPSSPGKELLSLQQFLAESEKTPRTNKTRNFVFCEESPVDVGQSAPDVRRRNGLPPQNSLDSKFASSDGPEVKGLNYYSSTLSRRTEQSMSHPRPKSTFELTSPKSLSMDADNLNGNQASSHERHRNGVDLNDSSPSNTSYAESKFSTLDNRKKGTGPPSVALRHGPSRPVSTPARRFSHGGILNSASSPQSSADRLDWLIGNSPIRSSEHHLFPNDGSPVLTSVPEVGNRNGSASTTSSRQSAASSTPVRPIPTRPSQSSTGSPFAPSSTPRANRSSTQSAPAKDIHAHPPPYVSPSARTITNKKPTSEQTVDSFGSSVRGQVKPKLLTTSPSDGESGERTKPSDGQPDPVEKNSIWYEYGCV